MYAPADWIILYELKIELNYKYILYVYLTNVNIVHIIYRDKYILSVCRTIQKLGENENFGQNAVCLDIISCLLERKYGSKLDQKNSELEKLL